VSQSISGLPEPSHGGASRLRSQSAMGWLLAGWLFWAAIGFVWTPYDPGAQDFLDDRFAQSSPQHWLGVDSLGRDLFSRIWRGSGWTVLMGGVAAVGMLTGAGALLAIERRAPRAVGRMVRAMASAGLAMPVMLFGFVLLVFLPSSPWSLVLACAIGAVPFAFRQLRIIWVEQATAVHVMASRALGARWWHQIWFSIWPNVRSQVLALARLLFAVGVLELSGLAFLGLGGDPDFPELGTIMRQNQTQLFANPLLVVWPAVFLSGLLLTVHASNLQMDAVRRISDSP